MEKMNQAFEKVKILVGMEVDKQSASSSSAPLQENGSFSFMDMDEINRNCTLSTKQRFYGFAICLTAGLTCTLLSMLVFFNPVKFGITFTLGNLMALGSTAFLIGPKRQVNMMLDPVRIYATAIYLASIIIALFCALYVHNKLLTLLAIILEFGALICFLGGRSTFSKHVLILYEKSEMLFAKSGALTLPIIILWLLRPKYSLSYIPFARSMVSKIMVSCFDTEF